MNATVLIVDDEPVQRRLLESHLNKMGYCTLTATDGEEAIAVLQGERGSEVKALVLDLVMPGLDGMGTLGRMRELGLQRPTVVQTAQAGIDTVVSAMRAGATDFCVKPVSFERLKISIANAMKLDAMEDAVRKVERSSSGTFSFADMIAQSPAMDQVLELGERAAASTIPVLIEGESGTGKEVLARAIHGAGDRRGKPLVTVNCGALPENLAESILFGHEKGSLYRGDRHSHWQVQGGRRRDAVSRRGRRAFSRTSGQTSARDPGGRDRSGRRQDDRQDRFPPDLSNQSRT